MNAAALASAIFGTWYQAGADGAFAVERTSGALACANPRFAELLGRDASALAGAPFDSLLPEETSRIELLTTFGHRDHVAFRHAAGGVVYLTLTIAPVYQPGHGPLVACLCRDTTGARRLEQERLTSYSKRHAPPPNNPMDALASTLRRLEGHLEAVTDPEVRETLHRMVQRSREIGVRIEGNINAVVRAHEAGIADPTCHWLVLHRKVETALSMFADRLDRVMAVRDHAPARPQDPTEDPS